MCIVGSKTSLLVIKKNILIVFVVSLYLIAACKKGNDSSGKLCTSCTARKAGKITSPYKFCGTIQEVENEERKYINSNRRLDARAKCIRN
mgnify:FL=1